jgi:hypothetical protein
VSVKQQLKTAKKYAGKDGVTEDNMMLAAFFLTRSTYEYSGVI